MSLENKGALMVKLNHKIPIISHNLRNYDSHLIMQEPGKFDFKINVIPNEGEKYMSFNISDKFLFYSFQFLSSSLDSLVQNLGEHDFNYLSQGSDSKVLDIVKQKGFYEYMSDFERVTLPSKEKFYSSLTNKKISDRV